MREAAADSEEHLSASGTRNYPTEGKGVEERESPWGGEKTHLLP